MQLPNELNSKRQDPEDEYKTNLLLTATLEQNRENKTKKNCREQKMKKISMNQ